MRTQPPRFKFQKARPLISLALILSGLLIINVTSASRGYAASPDNLSGYEQALFSRSYEDESLPQRLDRLENSVFGESRPQDSVNERQARLLNALGAARKVLPGAGPPSENTATDNAPQGISGFSSPQVKANPDNPPSAPQTASPTPPPTPDATDYPTVTALERQVFGRDFIREDIHHRLDRLERKVFGQNYPQTELVDRVDKLLSRYPGVSARTAQPAASDDYAAADSAISNLPDDPSAFMGSSRDVYAKVDALEKKVFNGKTNPNALLTERLDRLEAQVLTRQYSGESVDTRVSRLLREFEVRPGFQARPGFRNRPGYQGSVAQNSVSGVSQVITPGGYGTTTSQSTTTSVTRAPQNIQIGAGIGQNSSYQFSPEMMSMLPPSLRSQMRSSSQSGTVIGAPGTVVIEQSTTTASPGFTPGFVPYGGQPMQYYNYYGSPATQMQSQTTTTVLQPDGSAAVYSYPGAGSIPGNPNGLPNPAYVGDPAFLQSLNNLESHVFGQINTVDPVSLRLGKLESAMLGQMYVGYPESQRLSNLERAYQVQAVGKLLGQSKGRTPGSPMMGIPLNTPNPMNVPPIPMNMGIPGR